MSTNPIATIRSFDIPVDSVSTAIQYANDIEQRKTKIQYENMIGELVFGTNDMKVVHVDMHTARYVFLYLLQEILHHAQNSNVFDMPALYDIAIEKAQVYMKKNKWVYAWEDKVEVTDTNGKPKRKKGFKQEESKRIYLEHKDKGKKVIIDMFMEDLDMSKSGATTYFYNCKKKYGV